MSADPSSATRWLLPLAVVAIAIGAYARFIGIGTWPLAIDEYYIARSIENILRVGFPEYVCGGFYTRGILFQYVAALLQLSGASPELAPRLIAAVCGLLTLPAVYLLGKRIGSTSIGWLGVIILALSIWEIEMSRFGRMYAPFQTVFVWYLVHFVKYTVDDNRRSLLWMIALSILGVLVWEGGALLGLANLFSPFMRRPAGKLLRRDWIYLGGMIALFLPMYYWAMNDLRYASDVPALPDGFDFDAELAGEPTSTARVLSMAGFAPFMLAFALVPLLCALPALGWIWKLRERWLAAVGLLAVVAAAALHQLLAAAAILLLLLLTRLISWGELKSRNGVMLVAAIAAFTAFWLVVGILTLDVAAIQPPALAHLAYEFVRFPDVVMAIARPWYRAAPFLGLGLALLIGFASVRAVVRESASIDVRTLLALLIILLLAASMTDAPRAETRYIYFAYPLIIVIALFAIHEVVKLLVTRRRVISAGTAGVALLSFSASEDFQPYHLRDVDSYWANFRIGMPSGVASHYHPRSDIRAAGEWLSKNARDPDMLVVNAFPGVDFYFKGFDYTFVSLDHQRYRAYACEHGTRERWGSHPLLDELTDIDPLLKAHGEALIVLTEADLRALAPALRSWNPRTLWSSPDSAARIVQLRDPRR
jgi:hypothetical protein